MIVGGFAYYWRAGRGTSKKSRRRAHANVESEENVKNHIVRNAVHAQNLVTDSAACAADV